MKIEKYEIYLKLEPENTTFLGRETIYIDNNDNRKVLSLDFMDLEIDVLEVDKIKHKISLNHINKTLDVLIPNGKSEIYIEYKGKISNLLVGLYRVKHDNGVMLSTQFESVGARRVFPSIDNPEFKSIFQLFLDVKKPYDAISNSKILSIKEKQHSRIFIFNDTPLMSTYLLYIGVGKFKVYEDKYKNIDINLVSPIEIKSVKAIKILKKSLQFLEEYFDIIYPLPKIDLIAVPEFAAGAMENWGAITFREIYLNLSKKTSTEIVRASAEVITHELVHQWFGNLVTMKWWNDLWLNESFATFMAFITIIKLYPQWHFIDNFLYEKLVALSDDSLNSTHPIEVNIKNIEDIEQSFDSISYNKGASILYMLYNFIGDESFRNGLRSYLLKYQYKNAEGFQLWEELDKFSDFDIVSMMKSWIKYPGYPLIKATLIKDTIEITQERFFLLNENNVTQKLWPIPLIIKNGDDVLKILFNKKSLTLKINPDHEVNINYMNSGFYRIFYDNKLLSKLTNSHNLTGIDIFNLLNDRYSLFISGIITLNDFISFIKNFYKRKDYIVVNYLTSIFNSLLSILYNNILVKSNAIDFFYLHIEYLGIETRKDEIVDDNILRGNIMSSLAKIDDNFAMRISQKYSNLVEVSPDLKRSILISKSVVGEYDLQTLFNMYKKSKTDEAKMNILSSIFASKKPENIKSLYSFMLDKNIKVQDWPSVIIGSVSYYLYRDMAWEFMIENIETVLTIFQGSYVPSRIMQSIIPYIGIGRRDQLLKFLKNNFFKNAESGISNGLEYLKLYENLDNKYNNI